MVASLPPELTEKIISHLADDKVSLLSCAAVCRSWAIISRLLYLKLHRAKVSPSQLDRFLEMISSPYSTFDPYLSSLELHDRWKVRSPFTRPFKFSTNGPVLTALRHLVLTESDDLRIQSIVQSPVFQYFQHVTKLTLAWVNMTCFTPLISLISSLSIIESLTLSFVALEKPFVSQTHLPEPKLLQTKPPSTLRVLELQYGGQVSTSLFNWLLASDVVPNISVLRLDAKSMSFLAVQFIHRLGPELKHLAIDNGSVVSNNASPIACMFGLNLAHTPKLQTLEIAGLGSHQRWNEFCKPAVPLKSILATIKTCSVLEQISLFITMSEEHFEQQITLLDLKVLEPLVFRPGSENSTPKVRFWFKGKYESYQTGLVEQMVMGSLPRCFERGVVEVRFVGGAFGSRR